MSTHSLNLPSSFLYFAFSLSLSLLVSSTSLNPFTIARGGSMPVRLVQRGANYPFLLFLPPPFLPPPFLPLFLLPPLHVVSCLQWRDGQHDRIIVEEGGQGRYETTHSHEWSERSTHYSSSSSPPPLPLVLFETTVFIGSFDLTTLWLNSWSLWEGEGIL